MSKKAATTPNRKIPSVKELFELHSRCRVVVADTRPRLLGIDMMTGQPQLSRALSRIDVLAGLIRKYAK
jgi:hypothetical protein